ncbi:MAG TPA: GNAT family N-acetyltransferase [Pyrinomonadaceae bacterium]|jgi:RimJ/RimL family protein N-acetyltransferase|nr:GNAT family N-acetyltransferase [Pyrinomonadaceae bacterium]
MIENASLKLIPCELQHFEAILEDQKRLQQMLGVTVFEDWFDFPGVAGIEAIRFGYEYLKANRDAPDWWMYLFIHAKDNVLVGMGGYKGKANELGMVEIGYAIVPAYRGLGLATEAARGLIDYAFSHQHIRMVDAHTLAERNASTRVLEKAGMKHVGMAHDPDVGEVWHWSLKREDFPKT